VVRKKDQKKIFYKEIEVLQRLSARMKIRIHDLEFVDTSKKVGTCVMPSKIFRNSESLGFEIPYPTGENVDIYLDTSSNIFKDNRDLFKLYLAYSIADSEFTNAIINPNKTKNPTTNNCFVKIINLLDLVQELSVYVMLERNTPKSSFLIPQEDSIINVHELYKKNHRNTSLGIYAIGAIKLDRGNLDMSNLTLSKLTFQTNRYGLSSSHEIYKKNSFKAMLSFSAGFVNSCFRVKYSVNKNIPVGENVLDNSGDRYDRYMKINFAEEEIHLKGNSVAVSPIFNLGLNDIVKFSVKGNFGMDINNRVNFRTSNTSISFLGLYPQYSKDTIFGGINDFGLNYAMNQTSSNYKLETICIDKGIEFGLCINLFNKWDKPLQLDLNFGYSKLSNYKKLNNNSIQEPLNVNSNFKSIVFRIEKFTFNYLTFGIKLSQAI
jgi:hypothetical protein